MHAGRHRIRSARCCAVMVVLLFSFLRNAPVLAAEPTPFKVGLSEAVNTALAIWMADEAGFYAGNGLKVEIINMQGGSRGAAELAAGRLDAMHVGLSSVIGLNKTGADLRAIAALANVVRFTFFSAPGVTKAADLKGGVVGISSFGSETDATVTLALQRLGLTRNDVMLKEYGGGGKRIVAVRSGEIKATAVNEPVASMARGQGVHVLFDLVPERIPWLFTAIVVKRSMIDSRREQLVRFVKATAEGNALALADAKRAKEVLARMADIKDPKILDISYEDFRQLSPANIEPTKAAAENIMAQFPDASRNLGDYVDLSILDELKNDGVFTVLRQKYKN
jgi:ABC-type nitrate/sulfonate/bicarbonate transport system substrate-binding protein